MYEAKVKHYRIALYLLINFTQYSFTQIICCYIAGRLIVSKAKQTKKNPEKRQSRKTITIKVKAARR